MPDQKFLIHHGPMKFAEHEIAESCIVYKSSHSFLFVNIRPFLPYHLLLSPIEIKKRMHDLDEEEAIDLMKMLRMTLNCLERFGTGCTVALQDGESAGQTVQHVHFHIIPRNTNDIPDNNDIYDKANLDVSRANRAIEEQAEEAAFLRKIFIEENSL